MITGFPANPIFPANQLTWQILTQTIDAGRLIWVGTKPGPVLIGGLSPNHIYSVASYVPGNNPPATGIVMLDNPHGVNNATLTFNELLQAIQEWWVQ
jgi:hypothetical protein